MVVVGDGSLIGAGLEPPEVRGGWRGRFDLVLFNRARGPLRVDLGATSPDPSVRVRLRHGTEVLVPGKEVRVRGRVEAHRPMVGSPKRHPFAVRVQGRTTPVAVEGTFHQRAVIGSSFTRIVAIGLVVALWAAVATLGIRSLDNRLQRSAVQRQNAATPPPPAAAQPSGGSGTGPGGGSSGNGSQGGSASGGGSSSGGGGGLVVIGRRRPAWVVVVQRRLVIGRRRRGCRRPAVVRHRAAAARRHRAEAAAARRPPAAAAGGRRPAAARHRPAPAAAQRLRPALASPVAPPGSAARWRLLSPTA